MEHAEEKEEINNDELDEVPEFSTIKKSKSKTTAMQYVKSKVSKKEILQKLREMNPKQEQIFYEIRKWALELSWKLRPEPFHIFVTGGAGTGKSHLIKCMFHESSSILAKTNENPDEVNVLLVAPTGTAAFKVVGQSIHSAFSISKNIKIPDVPLGESILNTIGTKFDNLQLVVIDEISMVAHKLLTYIHGKLCQIKHSKKPFGNISVLYVGGFCQLPPVRASPLCKAKDSLFLDHWNPFFSIVTLTDVMKQKDDEKFALMLNRLRIHVRGEPLHDEDLKMF